jgi:hypothetical protein
MRFRIPSVLKFSRLTMAGLGLVVLVSMFGASGCMSRSLTQVYVEPSGGACVSGGGTAQFTAYGVYTEAGHETTTQDITDSVTWTSDLPEVGSVNSTGLVTASTTWTGDTDIKASAQGEFGVVWGSATFTVPCASSSPSVITGLKILPGDQNLQSIGDTTKTVAVGRYSGAPWSRDLSEQATWTSSNPAVAKVTPGGLVTATGSGEATITATTTSERGTTVTSSIKVVVGSAAASE